MQLPRSVHDLLTSRSVFAASLHKRASTPSLTVSPNTTFASGFNGSSEQRFIDTLSSAKFQATQAPKIFSLTFPGLTVCRSVRIGISFDINDPFPGTTLEFESEFVAAFGVHGIMRSLRGREARCADVSLLKTRRAMINVRIDFPFVKTHWHSQ
jgi:hypothetical protein